MPSDTRLFAPLSSERSGTSSAMDGAAVVGGGPALVGADDGGLLLLGEPIVVAAPSLVTTMGARVIGVLAGTGAIVSHGSMQESVARQSQVKSPPLPSSWQSHSSEGYVTPQQVSVPSVQVAPAVSHGVIPEHVPSSRTGMARVDATTTGARVIGVLAGTGAIVSHGSMQESVARQSQVKPPPLPSSWQLHSSEGYVTPQQVSVPSVQVAPAVSHGVIPEHVPSSP